MIDLGKGISDYEDDKTVQFLFEEPYHYHRIFDDDYHIVSGRKGTGKSTIVDYQNIISKQQNQTVIVIRPQVGDELYDTIKYIAQCNGDNLKDQRQNIAKLLEFLVFTILMRHFVDGVEDKFLTGELAAVYDFLTSNKMIEGSIVRRSLRLLSQVTQEYKELNRLFSMLSKASGPRFIDAKESVLDHIKRNKLNTRLFIDDIDAIGFEYSPETKTFLEALVIACMSINLFCVRAKVPFRMIITPPTELFDTANFWNRDKIMRKTIFLRWNNLDKLRNLINKRISAELNIRKRKRSREDDIYSTDPEKSWKKIFPERVRNRVGSKEETLEYIARHTFYSPRTVLDICTDILSRLEQSGYNLGTINRVTDNEWDIAVQDACEEKSIEFSRSITDIMAQIYSNIDEFLSRFEGRPNIWTKNGFLSFLNDANLPSITCSTDNNDSICGERLIFLLYKMGFLGLAFRNSVAPTGCEYFDLAFSYLVWTQKRKYDFIIVSPVFYDAYNFQPIHNIVVVPSKDLKLTSEQVRYLQSYNHRSNAFDLRLRIK